MYFFRPSRAQLLACHALTRVVLIRPWMELDGDMTGWSEESSMKCPLSEREKHAYHGFSVVSFFMFSSFRCMMYDASS